MLLTKILISVCSITIAANFSAAQTNGQPAGAIWGKPVQSVRLSITLTNSVVEAGLSILVLAEITNASTNPITIVQFGKSADYDLMLTNALGKEYHLIPPFVAGSTWTVSIKPGQSIFRSLPVSFGPNIEAGDYVLKATHLFIVKDERFTLESNLLKVQIK